MIKVFVRCAMFGFVLLSSAASAEPIKLKFSFFSSDRSLNYLAAVKPFVDAVNAEASGVVEIEVFLSGELGKNYAGVAQQVLDGSVDIGWVSPSLTPDRFPDNIVMELPGLFRDASEATLVYTRIIASGAMKGYKDYFVVAAFGAGPQGIHTRPQITSLNDLKGKRIRQTNRTEGELLRAFGVTPIDIPVNQTAHSIINGKIDGASVSPITLVEFGTARATSYHYFLPLGVTPLLILMNKARFDSLPTAAQEVIRKYSGEWLAARFTKSYASSLDPLMKQLKSDSKRTVIYPSRSDLEVAHVAFKTVIDAWTAQAPHNRELLTLVRTQIAKLQSERVPPGHE
jgi:TRAP-type C4-dicarboxylate transport system substrate-binding protein